MEVSKLKELRERRLQTIRQQEQQQKDAYEKLGKDFEDFHLPRIEEAFTSGASRYIFNYGENFPNFYIPKNTPGHFLFKSLRPFIKEYIYDRGSKYPDLMFEQIIFKSSKELQKPLKKSSRACVLQ